MNAVVTAQDRLLVRLLELVRSGRTLPCLCLRAAHSHLLKAFDVDGPLIALPLQGHKRTLQDGTWLSTGPGEIFLVPGPRTVDVENIPDPHSGEYLAIGVPLGQNVLEAARQLIRQPVQAAPGPIASVPIGPLLDPLTDWLDALEAGNEPRACHGMLGVVMRLYEMGHHGLLATPQPTLGERVRELVACDPARDWRSPDIEHALGMSGASLRRHLAAEGASLREIIVSVRLAEGLRLLYSTRLPIKSVARRVGYSSVSSFAKRFAERYGIEPSRIGNA